MGNPASIRTVDVVTTGHGRAHREHVFGTRKPWIWWIFFAKQRVRVPINVYVIEHDDGLVLFDTGVDLRVITDEEYWPGRITKLFMANIFEWDIDLDDDLATQLDQAGYAATDVTKVVISHLHADHAGGIGSVPQADLYVAQEAWDHMMTPHSEREMVLRRDIAVLGARWRGIAFTPTDDPSLAPFTESYDLMGDGSMIVLPTPGHLPGAVSMLVRQPDGPPLLLIGDLTYSEDLLQRDVTPPTGDTELLLASFAKVRALKKSMPDLVILPAHDVQARDKLNLTREPRAPQTVPG